MEIASVISRKRLGNHDCRHFRGPDSSPTKLGKTGALSSERTDSAAIENQNHALRLPFLP
jgi:hypothetical protein